MVHQDHHDYITVLHQFSAMNICHFVPCCICCASDKIPLRCPHLIGEKTNLHTISFRYLKCGLCIVLTKCYSYAIQPVHIKKAIVDFTGFSGTISSHITSLRMPKVS